jgi:hypothetical protein
VKELPDKKVKIKFGFMFYLHETLLVNQRFHKRKIVLELRGQDDTRTFERTATQADVYWG